MTRRREVLVAGASLALLGLANRAPAGDTHPPCLVRFEGRAGRLRLPDGTVMPIPIGSEVLVEPPRCRPDALMLQVVPIDESRIFASGFES